MPAGASAPERAAAPAPHAVAIIAALASERRTLNPGSRIPPGRRVCTVIQSGPGPDAARSAAQRAVRAGATALVSWGLAGGLHPDARTGVVVLPRSLVASGQSPVAVSADWHERVAALLAPGIAWLDGPLAGVEAPVITPAAKAQLAVTLEADAVDMESNAVARVAQASGLPFLAVRVVVDGPADPLPAAASSLVSPAGNVRFLAAALAALRSKDNRRSLRELGRRSAIAHNVLRQVAGRLVAVDFAAPGPVQVAE